MAAHYEMLEDGVFKVSYDTDEENPRFGEVGLSVPVSMYLSEKGLQRVLEILHTDAANVLPAGTVYDLRVNSQKTAAAWYHVDAMKNWPLTEAVAWPGKINPLGGYFMLGTFRTPK
jgi:hypothetical protein